MARKKKNNTSTSLEIVQHFNNYFCQNGGGLEDWQRLCRDLGIQDDLSSIRKCRKAIKSIHVNIYDLLDAVRDGTCPPQRFGSQAALREYTVRTRRIYPKRAVKDELGPVRALLKHIFGG